MEFRLLWGVRLINQYELLEDERYIPLTFSYGINVPRKRKFWQHAAIFGTLSL